MAENPVPSVSVHEHLTRVLAAVAPMAPVDSDLPAARGRVLAEDVVARVAVPGFDNSAMDGYAVRRADVEAASPEHPVTLRVVAALPAGSGEDPAIAPGEAVRIMTGAPLPSDADAVIPQEETDLGAERVAVHAPAAAHGHVRAAGSDVRVGTVVLPAGRVLGSRDIAAAAASGASRLRVHPAPRVAVLSTGDELVAPGEPLGRGRIHDSNSYLLEAAVAEAGGIPVRVSAVPDDTEALRGVFERLAGEMDAVVTSGGVSVGDYDVVKALLRSIGSVWFGPVRMQPGKPQGFGAWSDGTPIFTLPGNPVSVFVSFETFVRPALLAMQGHRTLERPLLCAVAAEGWRSPAGREQHMPIALVRDENEGADPGGDAAGAALRVRPAARGGSASHLVASLAGADGVAIIAEEVTEVQVGTPVDVRLVRP